MSNHGRYNDAQLKTLAVEVAPAVAKGHDKGRQWDQWPEAMRAQFERTAFNILEVLYKQGRLR